jgi:hypothetical protein
VVLTEWAAQAAQARLWTSEVRSRVRDLTGSFLEVSTREEPEGNPNVDLIQPADENGGYQRTAELSMQRTGLVPVPLRLTYGTPFELRLNPIPRDLRPGQAHRSVNPVNVGSQVFYNPNPNPSTSQYFNPNPQPRPLNMPPPLVQGLMQLRLSPPAYYDPLGRDPNPLQNPNFLH